MSAQPAYKRILLKLSGEGLSRHGVVRLRAARTSVGAGAVAGPRKGALQS